MASLPKRPADLVGSYFVYDPETNRSKCNIRGCKTSLAGKHTANLERHVNRNHGQEALALASARCALKRHHSGSGESSSSSRSTTPTECNEDSSFEEPKKKRRKLSINMNMQTLLDACVKLVTVNGRPLSTFEDSGMKMILDPIVEAVGLQQSCAAINKQKVLAAVQEEAKITRSSIRKELEGRLISIKSDTATRLDRSILGVNAQFCKNGRLILRNLAVKELHIAHTSVNIANEVSDVLAEYGVTPSRIYSSTTDNAANFVKSVEELGKKAGTLEGNEEEEFEDQEPNNEEDCRNEEVPFNFNADDSNESTLLPLPEDFAKEGVFGVRCAAHTAQLAVGDSLKSPEITKLLNKARNLCKKLRTPTTEKILSCMGYKKPPLDCPTRWLGLYYMVVALLNLRDVCDKVVPNNGLSASDWDFLKEIADSLEPAKKATKILQYEQLTIGNFVEVWLRCKCETKEVKTTLAQRLFEAMEKREGKLFDSPAILCGIFMDPRWRVLLNPAQKSVGMQHLLQVWRRLEALQPEIIEGNNENLERNEEEVVDPVERILLSRDAISTAESTSTQKNMTVLLLEFCNEPRLPRSTDVLKYWEKRKSSDPELYKLATTVLGVPATQVSVERVFSNLKFILNCLRYNLKADVVDDILCVRCNRIFERKV